MFHSNGQDPHALEKYSSAVTLGDMEIFVFPELLYSLVLANILSPRLWAWREDDWFRKIASMNPYRRTQRLRQFVMDRYDFNLDLDTWGLTTKERELARFRDLIDPEILARSNALFGYEGDKYYFDLDIRKHFGLDKYNDDAIPYWKTETLEAMDAFRHKPGFNTGAGECVSLSTLYAAALFVVARIPLEDIFLLATPLHSQNFVKVREGMLTNNRRIVTKNMWFNGTEITWKAQRALRNEQITLVANNTGHIHTMYPEATIDRQGYEQGMAAMREFLTTRIDLEILANFLRQHSPIQRCFQIRHNYHGHPRYIEAEKVYAYEHASPYRISDDTRDKLLEEVDAYEYYSEPIQGRIVLNTFEDFFKQNPGLDLHKRDDLEKLVDAFGCTNARARNVGQLLLDFCHIEPKLPAEKIHVPSAPIELKPDMDRDEMVAYLESLRPTHPVADLAFYAYRDLSRTAWEPFLKAAVERNPVVREALAPLDDAGVAKALRDLPEASIYDAPRVAQPDEVWNFQRGDGLEKALALASVLKQRQPAREVRLEVLPDAATVRWGKREERFASAKGLRKDLVL